MVLGLMAALTACSGPREEVVLDIVPPELNEQPQVQAFDVPALPFAQGPIQAACEVQGREAASTVLCGCIQAVADQSLLEPQQRRGVKYFKDPAALQEVRQSDSRANEKFWRAWKEFGVQAEDICMIEDT
jgi:hypothetical protein